MSHSSRPLAPTGLLLHLGAVPAAPLSPERVDDYALEALVAIRAALDHLRRRTLPALPVLPTGSRPYVLAQAEWLLGKQQPFEERVIDYLDEILDALAREVRRGTVCVWTSGSDEDNPYWADSLRLEEHRDARAEILAAAHAQVARARDAIALVIDALRVAGQLPPSPPRP